MTKNYFDPALVRFQNLQTGRLSRMTSRRFPGADRFGSSAYKTDAPEGGGDDPAAREELLKVIQGKIDSALETRATKDELKSIQDAQAKELKDFPLDALRAMADDKTGVIPKLAEMGLKITQLESKATQEVKALDVRSQVAAWQAANKEAVQANLNGRQTPVPALEIRAAANPMTVPTVNVNSSPFIGSFEMEAGINDFIRATPVFWNFVVKGRTNSATYGWVNKISPQGAADFIAPGQYKPNISFSLNVETSIAKKVADSAKATMELLQDIDGMTTFIEQELKYQVLIKLNKTLMTGVNSSTVPAGIQTLSVGYTTTTIKTINPNYMDAIRAVVGQMRSGWLMGDITVFVNSIDAANMDLSKAVNSGVYLLPPFTTNNGQVISGARIIEDNNVPVGFVQAGFMQYYRILIYKDFSVSWGWENDDFTKNLVTAIGEMRLHQFFNSIYTGAFVYDTFANIIAAITTAP